MKALMLWLSVLCLSIALPVQAQSAQDAELWQALQQGGKVIMMRHATVDRSIGDSFLLDESCFTEKNLTDYGIKQAKAVYEAFKQHQIQVGDVLASPYCRTKDTAEQAFGHYQISPLLHLIRSIPEDKAKANMAEVRKILSDYQERPNMVMVTHRPNIAEITNIRLDVAQIAIFEPLGDGLYDFLGVLQVPVEP